MNFDVYEIFIQSVSLCAARFLLLVAAGMWRWFFKLTHCRAFGCTGALARYFEWNFRKRGGLDLGFA
jgi:hypothetical protein